MQTVKIVQAVALMLVVALAASCAASKQYTSKLFGPKTIPDKDSQVIAMKFLELDQLQDSSGWVTTSIVADSNSISEETTPEIMVKKVIPDTIMKSAPVAKVSVPAGIPEKDSAIANEPVAKSTQVNGVRNKKTRD